MDRRPRPTCGSSAHSMEHPLTFKEGHSPVPVRKEGPGPSHVSMKSNTSMLIAVNFEDHHPVPPRKKSTSSGRGSMKSHRSMSPPIYFEDGDPLNLREPGADETQLDTIFTDLEENILTFVKKQLQRLYMLLVSEYPENSEESEEEQSSREAVLNITLDFLRRMKREDLAEHLSINSDPEEFDLRKYCSSERALQGLLQVVKASTKAILSGCGLSPQSCADLASVLSSSSLTHLDLSNNDLQDSGVELLCEGLKSAPCRLHTLSLSGCLVSEMGGACLASTLSSAHSSLRELDLSYNHPGASAELLTALQAPHGPLQSLRLVPAGEQWMVSGLRKYSCEFSLDPNTAQRFLLLSEDKRTVKHVTTKQPYPEHKDRFSDWYPQVLSSTGLRGRCYWEVNWSGEVEISVSYRGIKRRGERHGCKFGENNQSWRLRIFHGNYSVCHNKTETPISSSRSHSGREGVFLDSEAGALSFYHVLSDGELFHLHTFSCSFTEPLLPGFGLWSDGDSVSVVDLKRGDSGGSM